MNVIGRLRAWRRLRRMERAARRRDLEHRIEIRRRHREFESNPARHARSPWIRSLIASPLWDEVPTPRKPRKISISHPEKANGRAYILDLLDLERCIRFRGYEWAWRGIFSAMGDDALIANYPEEHRRILEELRHACPDEELSPRGNYDRTELMRMAAKRGGA